MESPARQRHDIVVEARQRGGAMMPSTRTMREHSRERGARRGGLDAAAVCLAGLALLVVAIVYGKLTVTLPGMTLQLSYKALARALAIAWVVLLIVPFERQRLSYRPLPGDLPLALFAIVAALSVLHGGGHWGDVWSLLAGIGLGGLARSLFAPPARRSLILHYLGTAVLVVLARELVAHPQLLPPHESGRYALVTANPNPLGFLFAMMAPLFLAEAFARRRWDGRRIAATTYYGGAVLGTLLTFSRSAAFGFALGSVLVALALPDRRKVLLAGALGLATFVIVQRPDTWLRTRAPGDADRPRIMRCSLSLAADAPLLGIGFGINNLEERFPARYEQLYGERLFRFHSANQLIDLLVGTGVVGTVLAGCWILQLYRAARARLRAARGATRIRAAGRIAALVTIVAMSLNEPPLYAGKLVPLLFLVLADVQLGSEPQPRSRTGPDHEPLDAAEPGTARRAERSAPLMSSG